MLDTRQNAQFSEVTLPRHATIKVRAPVNQDEERLSCMYRKLRLEVAFEAGCLPIATDRICGGVFSLRNPPIAPFSPAMNPHLFRCV
jgi:hypothetical protein